jgi:hypothetical protein
VRGYLTNDLVLGVGVTDDEVFGTNTVVQVIWTPGRTGAGPTSWVHNLADRMREQVYRNQYVATRQVQTEGAIALTNADGTELRIVHVDSDAAPGGDGSFERPLNNLNDINANSDPGDVILAHASSTFTDQTATLQDEQRFLGEGGNITHTLATSERGTITIPETFDGASTATRPTIDNTGFAGDAVVLAGTTGNTAAFSAMEVNNFDIVGGDNAVFSAGVGAVTIDNLEISNTTGNAIELAALNENTDADAAIEQVRFVPTIQNTQFMNVGGDDIQLTSSTEPAATPTTETITITNIQSEGGDGIGIELLNTRRNANLSNIVWEGDANSDGAISVQDATTTANVNLSGTNSFTGTAVSATPDTTGYAIQLLNSAGAMTVTGTTITDTPGDSIRINGGSSNLTFTGRIDQSRNSSVVSVLGGHTGTVNFSELTANAGVIGATDGDGLQFEDADGTYRFNDNVTLNGGDAGIDVLAGGDAADGSEGTFTFDDVDITNPDNDAVVIDGNRLNTFTITAGDISTDNTSGRPLVITDNLGGSITIAADVNSTGQGILIENNTNTTVVVSGQTTLSTAANTALRINNHSTGSVSFRNNAANPNTLQTTTGVALDLNNVAVATGANADITFQSVNVTNGATAGIILNNVTGGVLRVTGTSSTDDSGGTIVAADDAVRITDARGVSLNNMNLSTTGGGGTEHAVEFNVTTGAESRLELANTSMAASGAAEETLRLNIGDAATTVHLRITGSDDITNTDDEAVLLTTSGVTQKTVNMLFQNNANVAGSSADPAANFQVSGGGILNATVLNNQFTNSGAGEAMEIATNSGGSQVHLDLKGNSAEPAGKQLVLRNVAGTFEVRDQADLDADNNNDVTEVGTISNETDAIPPALAP